MRLLDCFFLNQSKIHDFYFPCTGTVDKSISINPETSPKRSVHELSKQSIYLNRSRLLRSGIRRGCRQSPAFRSGTPDWRWVALQTVTPGHRELLSIRWWIRLTYVNTTESWRFESKRRWRRSNRRKVGNDAGFFKETHLATRASKQNLSRDSSS